jgi:hypothetical protein
VYFNEFNELSLSLRAELVEQEGKFLVSRTGLTYHVDLYRLDDFYVEIWNNTIHGILMNIHAFRDEEFLKPYLDNISFRH